MNDIRISLDYADAAAYRQRIRSGNISSESSESSSGNSDKDWLRCGNEAQAASSYVKCTLQEALFAVGQAESTQFSQHVPLLLLTLGQDLRCHMSVCCCQLQ